MIVTRIITWHYFDLTGRGWARERRRFSVN